MEEDCRKSYGALAVGAYRVWLVAKTDCIRAAGSIHFLITFLGKQQICQRFFRHTLRQELKFAKVGSRPIVPGSPRLWTIGWAWLITAGLFCLEATSHVPHTHYYIVIDLYTLHARNTE